MRSLVFLFVLVFCVLGSGRAATYEVRPDGSGDFPTIQAAVGASADGDVIQLTAGTFSGPGNENVDLLGKNLVIETASGVAHSAMIAPADGRAFILQSGEPQSTTLRGLHLFGGRTRDADDGNGGGAVLLIGSSVTLEECLLEGNSSDFRVGGAAVQLKSGSSLRASDSRFVDNIGNEDSGAAIDNGTDCTTWLEGCVFENNAAVEGGGGAIRSSGSLTIRNSEFLENSAGFVGGAIFSSGPLDIDGALFAGNFTAGPPGGGAIYAEHSLTMAGATLSDNHSRIGRGGGIYLESGVMLFADTTILWSNCSEFEGGDLFIESGASAILTCSLVDMAGVSGNLDLADDSLTEDPLFCAPGECVFPPASGDYHLAGASPCTAGASPCGSQIGYLGEGCDVVPIVHTSWGRLKVQFSEP